MANIVLSFLLLPKSQTTLKCSRLKPIISNISLALVTFLSTPSTPTLLPNFRVTTMIPPCCRNEARGRTSSLSVSRISRLASQTNSLYCSRQSSPTSLDASLASISPLLSLRVSALHATWDMLGSSSTLGHSLPGSMASTDT